MATATATAPITIGQINSSLYAGEPGFPTAQSCVDFARNQGGYWLIVIPHGYGGDPNPPSSLVGGTTSMWLLDQRQATWQAWRWNGTAFIPADFDQLGGFTSFGLQEYNPQPVASAVFGFDVNAGGGIGGAVIGVRSVSGGAMPSIVFSGYPSDGVTPAHSWMACGLSATGKPQTIMLNGLYIYNDNILNLWTGENYQDGAKGMAITGRPTENAVDIQGETVSGAYDQTLRLNHLGGLVQLGKNLAVSEDGIVHALGGIFAGPVEIYKTPDEPYNLWIGDAEVAPGAKGVTISYVAADNTIYFQGQTVPAIYDQILSLNSSGGGVKIGPSLLVNGDGSITGDPIFNGDLVVLGEATIAGPLRAAGGLSTQIAYIGQLPADAPGNKIMVLETDPPNNTVTIQGQTSGSTILYDQNLLLNPLGGNVFICGKVTVDHSGNIGTPGTLHVNGDTILFGAANVGGELSASGGLWTQVAYVGEPHNQAGNKIMVLETDPPNNTVTIQGQTVGGASDQTLQLQPYGGDTNIGQNVHITYAGTITAPNADFVNCAVDGSPVRTFANTPDGGGGSGMEWPPQGIAVSTGTAWGASINPATLYPTAGMAVSTGTGWTTSIDPATLPRLNTANTFTLSQTILGDLLCKNGNNITLYDPNNIGRYQLSVIANSGQVIHNAIGVNAGNYGTHTFRSSISDNSAHLDVMTISPANSGQVDVAGGLTVSGAITTNGLQINGGVMALNPALNVGDDIAYYAGLSNSPGNLTYYGMNYQGPASPNNRGKIGFVAGAAAVFDNPGNWAFVGTVTAAGKSFRIPHPLDETKDLVHSCLEGPEWGVYYRGEIVTANGTAEVTLPDYFEALTFIEERSVQLTQVFEDGAVLTMLAASRIVDGKFTVHSSAPIATVAWQVNAVRRFGENKLEVVTAKAEPPLVPTPQDEKMEG